MINLLLIYANEDVQLEVDEKNTCLQLTWLQHPSSDSFRHIITCASNYALAHQINSWMCDMRKIAYLEVSDQNWLVREIFSAFDPKRQHEYAYVVSTEGHELYSSYHIHNLVQEDASLKENIHVEIFFEKEIAQMWLLDQAKVSHRIT